MLKLVTIQSLQICLFAWCTWVVSKLRVAVSCSSEVKLICDLILPKSVFAAILCQLYFHFSVSTWNYSWGRKCLLIVEHMDNIEEGEKKTQDLLCIAHSFPCHTGIFLRVEIKSNDQKMSGTRGFAGLDSARLQQPGCGSGYQVGSPAKQNSARAGGLWKNSLLSPQNSASKTLRIPEKTSNQSGLSLQGTHASHCRCHVHLLAALTQVPSEAEEKREVSVLSIPESISAPPSL